MSAEIDPTSFLQGLRQASEAQLAAARQGLAEFAQHVIGDAQLLTPVDTGALQNSGLAGEVEGEREQMNVTLGFNTNYAAAVHERLEPYHPVGEAKFLEKAMRENAAKFAPYVAEKMKAASNG